MLKAYNSISLFSPSWIVKWIGEKEYRKFFKIHSPRRLLDIGCGSGEKKCVIPAKTHYTGVDHISTTHDKSTVDIFCTAYELPFPKDSYDFIFCTGVLEHLEEPEQALKEAYRVLEPGGYALYTIPLFWHLHEEPRDFYRYTKFGIKYLFEKTGFEIVELKALSGFWVTFGTEFNYYIDNLARGPLHFLVKPVIAVNNLIFFALDKLDRKTNRGTEKWTWVYFVVARKKNLVKN